MITASIGMKKRFFLYQERFNVTGDCVGATAPAEFGWLGEGGGEEFKWPGSVGSCESVITHGGRSEASALVPPLGALSQLAAVVASLSTLT
jgi:hypothetical protein